MITNDFEICKEKVELKKWFEFLTFLPSIEYGHGSGTNKKN